MQMEQYDKETCTLEEQKAQPADPFKVHIVAHGGGVVFAPIVHNVQGAKCIKFSQSVAGANVPEGATRDFSSLLTEYKESIISRHEYTREYNSCAGEQVPLEDRYVEPLIIQRHRVKKEREDEIRSRGNDFFNLSTFDTSQSIFTCNLFGKVDGKTNECTKAVILQGNSGNGKSFIAQKVILDWAKGDLFAGIFDVVFYLRCSELNCISEDISLVELLNCSEEMTLFLKDKQKRVLFLVDGFDELRRSLPEKALLARVDIRAKPGAILSSLLKGIMLKDSFLLVTTRSTATEQLGKLLKCPHRFTEIMGFSEKGVQEYFQRFFQDKELSTQVYEHVKTNHVLHTACSSPVMCWLICNVFKQKCNMGTSMKRQLKSTTSIFIDFVFTLMEHHCQGLDEAQKFMLLKNLGQLAVKGMLKGKFIFEKHDVPEVILNLASLPFLCTFKHKNGTRTKEMFTFMHLSFQEFFAALFYVLLNNSEAQTKIKKMLSSDLFKTYKYLHLLPVIQFLFGLSNKNETDFIHEKYQHVVPREIGSLLENWMQTFVKTREVCQFDEFTLQCLYEVNNQNVVKNVMKIWESGSLGIELCLSFSRMTDYQAVVYCLQFCRHISSLRLQAIAMRTLKMMETALSKCYNLHLGVTYVTDDDVADLISVLGKEKNLHHLRMDDGSLSDHSVQEIITNLSRQKSVGDIHLIVKAINYNNTEMIMNFQKCPKAARNLSLNAAPLMKEEESLCSEFSISTSNGQFEITMIHKDVDSSMIWREEHFHLSLGLYLISNNDIENLLRIFSTLKQTQSPQVEEHMDALLSLLYSTPALTTVFVKGKTISLKGAATILTFCQDRPRVRFKNIQFDSLKSINEEDICTLSLSIPNPCFENDLELKLCVNYPRFPQICESSPILLSLALKFMDSLEGATVNWEDLLKMNIQLMKANERTSFLLDPLFTLLNSMPSLIEVRLNMRILPENCAAEIIKCIQDCPRLPFFELNVEDGGVTLGMVSEGARSFHNTYTTLLFGCNHLGYHEIEGLRASSCIGQRSFESHEVLPCITLTMESHTDFYNDSWEQFFRYYNQLKAMSEFCSEYDQCMEEVLSHMNTITALTEVQLALRFLTVNGVSSILQLFRSSSSLCKIDVMLSKEKKRDEGQNLLEDCESSQSYSEEGSICSNPIDEAESRDENDRSQSYSEEGSICSNPIDEAESRYENDRELLLYKPGWLHSEIENDDLDFLSSLRVRKISRKKCNSQSYSEEGSICSNTSDEAESRLFFRGCQASNYATNPFFTYISLSMSEPEMNWRGFFQSYYETKWLKNGDPDFGEKTDALLSFLHGLPGLLEVEFGMHSLPASWAQRILIFFHENANIRRIGLLLERDWEYDEDSACTSLTFKRNFTDSMVAVKIHTLQDNTVPSYVCIKLPCSEFCNLDVACLLNILECLEGLNDNTQEQEVQINELISFLHSVPRLHVLKLWIGNLTISWATWILSFTKCHSLTKISVKSMSSSLVMEEAAISELEKKWTSKECVVVIEGIRCSNTTDKCSMDSWQQTGNKYVTLSFCGGRFSDDEPLIPQEPKELSRDEFTCSWCLHCALCLHRKT